MNELKNLLSKEHKFIKILIVGSVTVFVNILLGVPLLFLVNLSRNASKELYFVSMIIFFSYLVSCIIILIYLTVRHTIPTIKLQYKKHE